MELAPISQSDIDNVTSKLLAAGGLFATMPATINGIEYPAVFAASNMSLRDLLAMSTAETMDNEFMVYEEQRYTVRDTWVQACRFAHALIDEMGVKPADRVAIAMRNYPEWCIAYLGIIAAGCTVVPINAWWKSDEIEYALKDCGAKVVVVDKRRHGYIAPLAKELGVRTIGAHEDFDGANYRLKTLIDDAKSEQLPATPIDADSDFCILYTSGSTGKPKGALLTHRGVINAILSWSFLLEAYKILQPDVELEPENSASLLALPLFHVTASHSSFLLSFLKGRKIVFMYRWDAKDAVALINKEKVTTFACVPTMAHELFQAAGPDDLKSMVDIACGGAKRAAKHVRMQIEKFPEVRPSAGYGLTETNALATINGLGDYTANPDSAGRVVPPVTEIKIFDEEGKEVPIGSEGEVVIKSPVTFRGYLNLPEQTAAAFFEGGWFRTGDVGKFDENDYLYILDRLKDLIIRGGENISCLEVEDSVYGFEGVQEVAVFSVPDEILGEKVGAVIFPIEGTTLDLAALHTYLHKEMAGFKVPEKMWIAPQSLPRGSTDKIDKRFTRTLALQNTPHFES